MDRLAANACVRLNTEFKNVKKTVTTAAMRAASSLNRNNFNPLADTEVPEEDVPVNAAGKKKFNLFDLQNEAKAAVDKKYEPKVNELESKIKNEESIHKNLESVLEEANKKLEKALKEAIFNEFKNKLIGPNLSTAFAISFGIKNNLKTKAAMACISYAEAALLECKKRSDIEDLKNEAKALRLKIHNEKTNVSANISQQNRAYA